MSAVQLPIAVVGTEELEVVWLSLRVALLALALALVPAVALARWLARSRRGFLRTVVQGLVMLPLVLPPVVTGYLLLHAVGRGSGFGGLWHAWTGTHLSYSFAACVLAAGVVSFPLLVMALEVAFAGVDPRLEAVARSLGRGPLSTFARVTLPLALRGLASGAVLFTARALGEFGATIVVAGNIPGETRQIPLAVYTLLNAPGGEVRAWVLAGVSVALSFAALLATGWLARDAGALRRRPARIPASPAARAPRAVTADPAARASPPPALTVEVAVERGSFALEASFETRGPVLGVVGSSGSGKSTLLHTLAGLVRPRRGHVALGATMLCESPRRAWVPPERRGLALVPQDALLFPHLSVARNLAFAPGATAELASDTGRSVLAVLDLEPLLERRPAELSGGERQRVALGRALLSRPRWLLLDEPLASLDADRAREIMALLLETKRSLGVGMVYVSHRTSEVLALADDCIVLDRGRIADRGTPLEVLTHASANGDLEGVDNLLRLRVLRHEPEAGLTHLDLGGLTLAAPLVDALEGTTVDVGLLGEDVMLCAEPPRAISARNVLDCTVERIDPVGRETLVTVRVGDRSLRVRLTPGAVRELELAPKKQAVALVKTTACRVWA